VRGARAPLPRWVDVGLIPLANVASALLIAGVIVLAIGGNPLSAVRVMLAGALGDSEGIGYTLYYATNFVFTGLFTPDCSTSAARGRPLSAVLASEWYC